MEHAAFLNVGAESNADLVEIAAEDRTGPDGGSVVYGDLAGEHHVRGHVSVHGDLRKPLPQRYDLPLPSVVPPHAIGRLRNGLRRCLGGQRALEDRVEVGGAQGLPRDAS